MTKKDFKYENEEYYITDAYVLDNKDYILVIKKNIFDDGTIRYADQIVNKYLTEKDKILEYMLDNRLRKFYSSVYSYSDEYIKNNIGRPQITIDFKKDENHPNAQFNYGGVFDFCESKLDEHIISLEFGDDLEFVYGVEMNG